MFYLILSEYLITNNGDVCKRYFDILEDVAKLLLLKLFQLWVAQKVRKSTIVTET